MGQIQPLRILSRAFPGQEWEGAAEPWDRLPGTDRNVINSSLWPCCQLGVGGLRAALLMAEMFSEK